MHISDDEDEEFFDADELEPDSQVQLVPPQNTAQLEDSQTQLRPPQAASIFERIAFGLAVTKDLLPAAAQATALGYDIAQKSTQMGFTIGRQSIHHTANAMEYAVGSNPASASLRAVDGTALAAAEAITLKSISLSKEVVCGSMHAANSGLHLVGVEDGTVLRLLVDSGIPSLVGDDAAEAICVIIKMVVDFTAEMDGEPISLSDLYQAAVALSYLQQTSGASGAPVGRCLLRDLPSAGRHLPPVSVAASSAESVPSLMVEVSRYCRFAVSSYGHLSLAALNILPLSQAISVTTDKGAIAHLTGVREDDITHYVAEGKLYRPGFLIALDHVHREVVVAFRGTVRAQDVLTDLVCEHAPLHAVDASYVDGNAGGAGAAGGTQWAGLGSGGQEEAMAHKGMLRAANDFCMEMEEDVRALLLQAQSRRPRTAAPLSPPIDRPYGLVLCGHSLGAGMATLVAALWRHTFSTIGLVPGVTFRCFAFAPPCTLSLGAARALGRVHLKTKVPMTTKLEVHQTAVESTKLVRDMLGAEEGVVEATKHTNQLEAEAAEAEADAEKEKVEEETEEGAEEEMGIEMDIEVPAVVTSVIVGDDMVPRFGLASMMDLRETLVGLHREEGLTERVLTHAREAKERRERRAQRRKARKRGQQGQAREGGQEQEHSRYVQDGDGLGGDVLDGDVLDEDRLDLDPLDERNWAQAVLQNLKFSAGVEERTKLYPAGRILWFAPPAPEASVAEQMEEKMGQITTTMANALAAVDVLGQQFELSSGDRSSTAEGDRSSTAEPAPALASSASSSASPDSASTNEGDVTGVHNQETLAVVDTEPGQFGELVLSGTMFSVHLPNVYHALTTAAAASSSQNLQPQPADRPPVWV
jgi:hypothetical protein